MSKITETLSFGFEQTFTISNWWTEPGFTSTSDTPLKREKMLALTLELEKEFGGSYKESRDIWDHMQYEVFDGEGNPSFVVTMDPGSIEVKTQPMLAKDIKEMMKPLFISAEKADLVPYRNWWYGVKGATEGGCHVNMGGFTPQTNPLIKDAALIIKYFAFLHNRPYLTYPFMGPDTGPGGNAMRMDEKDDYLKVKELFGSFKAQNKTWSAQDVLNFFEKTSLVTEKSSAPSLYKFKAPDFLIEDRAQEAFRDANDAHLITYLRVAILSHLQNSDQEDLKDFPDLHGKTLTSFYLWDEFKNWAPKVNLNPLDYRHFFERQFPTLTGGEGAPENIKIKEGRRPRIITETKMSGGVAISKTIDTAYKRFEIYTKENQPVKLEANGIELISEKFQDLDQTFYHYLDIKFKPENPLLEITLGSQKSFFNINDMQWTKDN